jgi:hypothetical protein
VLEKMRHAGAEKLVLPPQSAEDPDLDGDEGLAMVLLPDDRQAVVKGELVDGGWRENDSLRVVSADTETRDDNAKS